MDANQKATAEYALYELGIVGEILKALGGADISGKGPIEGTAIEWLGEQIDRLTQVATDAIQGICPKPAA